MPGKLLASLKRASTLVTLLLFGLTLTISGWLLQQPSIVHAEGLSADQPGPTFTVNTTVDDALDAGCTDTQCTLREAITAANTAARANTIPFALGVNQTIRLTSALPAISGTGELQSAPTDISLSASNVTENEPAGTTVGMLSTTDPDSGDTFTYMLAPGAGSADNGSFMIFGNNILSTSAPFNYEAKSSYSIRIRATDQGGLWVEKPFTITVNNVNETPTDISLSSSAVTENEPAGATVGMLSTTDPDSGDTFKYTLESGTGSADNGSFIISGNILSTSVPFNYEAKNSYSIRVRTTDQGGLWFEKQFTVTVTNVNETPTDISLSATSVAENAPAGTTVGLLSTTDPDSGDTFTYTLAPGEGSVDNDSFNISDSSLRTSASFDYEAKSSYSIRVRTTDQGGLWFEQPFTITVTNVNETPTDISLSATSVAEDAAIDTVVGTLSTTDPYSGNTFTYTLAPGEGSADNDSFNISDNSLRTSASFDYATKNSYTIRVRTTDQGGLRFEQPFTITVTNSPLDFSLSNTHVTTAQSFVGTLSTVGERGQYTYTLQSSGSICSAANGADNSKFQVDGNALRRLATTLEGTYQVCLQTEDAKLEVLQKTYTIDVTASAPQPSTWTAELTSNQVIDGDPAGTLVGTVVSSVAGTTFKLTDSAIFPLNSAFDLSSDGSLTLAISANIHIQQNYPIRILATAPDGSTLSIDALIRVMKDGEDAGAAAGDDHGEVVEGGVIELDVLANDTMSNGASSWKTHEIIRYPDHGTARIGSIIYSPNSGYVGTDTITYRACDNLDFCVVGKLTLTVSVSHTYLPIVVFRQTQ
jgi:CSLREA domain-containing protein